MKILPLVQGIQKDITQSGIRLKNATTDGYAIANRAAKIYKQSSVKKYYNVTKSVTGKVVSNTTRKELPYIAGAIGTLSPIPFMGITLFCLGIIIRFSADETHYISDKVSKLLNHSKTKV